MKKEEQKGKKKCNQGMYLAVIAICTMVALLSFLTANTAALVVEKDIGTLTSEADTIVIGNVTDIQSQWEDGKIFTYVTVSAKDYIKGAKEGEITIKVPGGTVGDITCYVSDTPSFEKGEEVLTFLREDAGYFTVVGCYQGKYTVMDNKVSVSGKKIALEKVAGTIKDKITAGKGEEIETAAKIIEVVEETLNPELRKTIIPVNESKKSITTEVVNTTSGGTLIKYEGFEGAFPNDWGVYGNPTWDADDYKPYAGSWSGWCANGGSSGVDPEYNNYPNNMDAWMVYGPFSLSDATDARLTFYHWTQTENNYDYFYYGASTDGSSFLGTALTGDWTPWEQRTLDLSDYCGESQVWIGFRFGSDGSVTYKGTFLDEIYLEKTVDGDLPSPAITNVEISDTSINLGDPFTVRVDGTNNGGDANGDSSISLSFPLLDDTGDNSRVAYGPHDFNAGDEYILDPPANPGVTTIWHKDTGEMTAEYVLAEGGTTEGGIWSSGEDHFLTLQVTPKEAGTFYFYVRETLNTTTGGLRITDPSSSSYTDQQGYKVYRYAVQVGDGGCVDEYEPDNSPAEARWITTDGISQTLHTFEPAGDHDWVKFNAVSGTLYTIETSNLGSNSDTYIYLNDTDGTTLGHDDDGGVGLASKIEWPCTSAGTYYVMARHYSSISHGCDTNYDISVTEGDDYPHIDSITPNYGPANATQLGSDTAASDSTRVTIQGPNFGTSQGYVKFWRVGSEYHDAAIESWSGSQIVCRVPGGVSSYNKPDGSGNVYVMTSDGRPSNDANFRVTYAYTGSKWPVNSITYYVNPNTADCTGEETAVQAAGNTWNSAGADFSFIYGGTTSKTSVGYDGENSIIWKDYGYTGWLAVNHIYASGETVIENDIEFSDYYYWDTSGFPSISQYDVQSIATHELGHCLVLDDLYGSADSEKMMYGYGDSELVKRDLHPDDIAGIRDIYGTGGTPTLQVSISETPDPVTSGGTSQVTVHVTSSVDGSPVQGASVTISATGGSITPPSGTTDSNGDFKPTYHAPTVTSPTTYTISATASKTGYNSGSGSDQITVNPDGGQTVVRIDPPSQIVPTGPFTVTVTVDPAVPIAGTQFDLSFNPSLVSANSVTEGNLLNQGGASTYFSSGVIDNTAGTITGVAGAITTPGQTVSSSGVFATIQMTAKSEEGTSPLDLSNVIVGDINGNPVSITVNDGSVTVEPCPDWDVNCDGNVNVLDMIRVGQHWGETGSPHWIREDVNRDGHVNVLDMILIGQHWTG